LRSPLGAIGGTRKGCPYAVARAIVRAVAHGCHRGHPPVGATLAVALACGRLGCHCGHPQGVPLRGRPCNRPCGRPWASSRHRACRGDPCGRPWVPLWAPARGAPTRSPVQSSVRSPLGATVWAPAAATWGRPCNRRASAMASSGAPVQGRPLRSPLGAIVGTRKGCPYGVARAIVRAVAHGCHLWAPARARGDPCGRPWSPSRGHPQGVPLRGRPCNRPCGRPWVSLGAPAPVGATLAVARGQSCRAVRDGLAQELRRGLCSVCGFVQPLQFNRSVASARCFSRTTWRTACARRRAGGQPPSTLSTHRATCFRNSMQDGRPELDPATYPALR
jgi:hypothetical protein